MDLNTKSNFESRDTESFQGAEDPMIAGRHGDAAAGSQISARHLLARGKGEPRAKPRVSRIVTSTVMGTDESLDGAAPALVTTETVILTDDRQRILDTGDFPWRMICALQITGTNGIKGVGTGWFVGPRTLVTAGHCVHHPDLGGWATRIDVSPGRNGSEKPHGTVTSVKFSAFQPWVDDHKPEYDLGCIHLPAPLGEQLGWFTVKSIPDAELSGYGVNIAGYPADRGQGKELYHHANRILNVSEKRIFYDVDTYGGQSGSPAWVQVPGNEQPIVVGVHAYGTGATPANLGIEANSATRLIPGLVAQIAKWRKLSEQS